MTQTLTCPHCGADTHIPQSAASGYTVITADGREIHHQWTCPKCGRGLEPSK